MNSVQAIRPDVTRLLLGLPSCLFPADFPSRNCLHFSSLPRESSSPFCSKTLCVFWLAQLFLSIFPLLRPLFPIGRPHLPQIIPHIVFLSYSWPSLQSCCIRFTFVYGLSHSFISHSTCNRLCVIHFTSQFNFYFKYSFSNEDTTFHPPSLYCLLLPPPNLY
jgi:hypothetical protein